MFLGALIFALSPPNYSFPTICHYPFSCYLYRLDQMYHNQYRDCLKSVLRNGL